MKIENVDLPLTAGANATQPPKLKVDDSSTILGLVQEAAMNFSSTANSPSCFLKLIHTVISSALD